MHREQKACGGDSHVGTEEMISPTKAVELVFGELKFASRSAELSKVENLPPTQ